MIDTHAHIYLPEFDADRESMIERAEKAGIKRILMPAIDSTTLIKMLEVEKMSTGFLSMIGLHPCSVNQNYKSELQIVTDFLKQRKFVAIGEIGLDFYWDKTFTEQQFAAFHEQIELAINHNIPIAIHSRNAIDECIEVITQYPKLRGVFHCFSGSYEQATKIIDARFLLGIGGVVTFKNSGLDKVVERTGIQHLILETDAPYLAPVPFRGKRNEPSYIPFIVEKLSVLLKKTKEEIIESTTQNAIKLFNLN